MSITARTLGGILRYAESNEAVHKSDLRRGDQLVIATENSIYSIVAGDDSLYSVSGGWFDREGPTPVQVPIHGCTWGGSVIQTGVLAARGLRVEFANHVVTSPIRTFLVLRAGEVGVDRARLAESDQQLLSECGISWAADEVPVC